MMNINNRKRHLFRKAYADMYIKEEKYLQKEDCFPAPITGSFYTIKPKDILFFSLENLIFA